ncbi:unnamed protein product [Phyllotreta striolata]|uniref:CRAL-TRIO domain-containing protein n=1 Tax=Phyllotreta striolata TaxID=444603 RepID=A0A9N9TWU8_PHYSR|nr:unnamed protein product [Phyllotreta striolata]
MQHEGNTERKSSMGIRIETDQDGVPFIQLGSYCLRLDLEELSDRDKEKALTELNETPENVQYALAKLRELISNEPNLRVPVDVDEFLVKFLRPCKFAPETAFKIMRRYYRFKTKHPKYGVRITPNSVRHVFDTEVFKILPTRSPDGSRIFIMNIGAKWDPKKVTLEDMFKAVMVTMEIAMLEPKTQMGGAHVVLNMEGLSMVHFYQFSPFTAKLIADWVQECVAVRLRGIHIVNQPYIFNMLYAIFKPFLGEKLRKLIFFHGTNRKSLLERISADCLPEKFGGNANIPNYPGSLFSDMLFYYEHDFEVYNTYGYAIAEKPSIDSNSTSS